MISLKEKLIKTLIEKKHISEKDFKKALELQKAKMQKLSDILIELGFISKEELLSIISAELGIPTIELSRYKLSKDLIKLMPKKMAYNYHVLPVSKIGDVLTIVTSDPLNIFAIDDIATLTGYKISILMANEKDILEKIDEVYKEDTTLALEKTIKEIRPDSIEMVEDGKKEPPPEQLYKLVEDAPIVKITDRILKEAIKSRASDILLEPMEGCIRVRFRIDGVLTEWQKLPRHIHPALTSRLKVVSELDIAERRLPQDGRFKMNFENREIDFRISVVPTSIGEKVALRVLDKTQIVLDIDKLGFEEDVIRIIKEVSKKPHGMILACGPTGCGKTTTLYSILKYVDSPEKNIVTAEDPIEYQLEGINQVAIRPNVGLTFASILRSFLRQDPDVILVGEIRDYETVDIAIKAALTGHLVLSTLHTTTSIGSIVRLINMGVEPFLITSSLIIVIAQRLVRKICSGCKTSYRISEALARELGFYGKADKLIAYRGKGCKRCANTGYKGRAGLAEILLMTPDIKNLILEKARETELKKEAKREGMLTLREHGLKKILDGITTIEEVLRVTVGEQSIRV